MYRYLKVFAFFLALGVCLSACSSIPDHAEYIPGDAVVVVGINTKEIGKKIAWNAIMGSKIIEEMQKRKTGTTVSDPSQAGIEMMSTSYVYVKPDTRFNDDSRVTALIPLENAGKWEDFVTTTFPDAQIRQQDKYKDAQLADGMYVGWNEKMLVVMNTIDISRQYQDMSGAPDSIGIDSAAAPQPETRTDDVQLSAEMAKAFSKPEKSALTSNSRFTKLEKAGHDITLWINYDQLMEHAGEGMGNMMGISLSNALWKNSAMAAGFDFEKGEISGEILHYLPDALKPAGEAFGKTNADKELVERLPGQNLDMLMAWHLSPKGVRIVLEKTGLLGFINLALSGEGLSADYILEAFTGDMAVSLNALTLEKQMKIDSVPGEMVMDTALTGNMDFTYAIKVNKKENFDKLVQMGIASGALQSAGNGIYHLRGSGDPIIIAIDGRYCVVTNRPQNATSYLQGAFKKQPKPAAATIYGNPFGVYFDAQSVMNAFGPGLTGSMRDSSMLAESKTLLKDISFKGGNFKSSAFKYHMSINFINKDENALLQLMDFAMRMDRAGKEALTARK